MSGGNSFSPNPVTVRVGQRVRWFNADTLVHTATQNAGAFDTGPILPGTSSTSKTLSVPGTLGYHCSIHPTMVGTLIVTR